jgi:hypothetical protein
MRHVQAAYGLSQSTQRNLGRLGKIEMVRLVGTGGGKLVRVNLSSVDRYFASLPKVEPGTGRWLGPERDSERDQASPLEGLAVVGNTAIHGANLKNPGGR